MKIKIIFGTIIILLFIFAIQPRPVLAYQEELIKQTEAFAGPSGADLGSVSDPRAVVVKIINVALGMVGALFLSYTIYAGYIIMASAGEEDKINKGKSTLRTSVIGLLVVMASYSILYFITRQLFWAAKEAPDGEIQWRSDSREYSACEQGRGDPVSC